MGAGNNTYVWLDKRVSACMHVLCPFACSRLYKPFFFPLFPETKQELGNAFFAGVSVSVQDGRGGAGPWGEVILTGSLCLRAPAPPRQELLNHLSGPLCA